MSEKEHASAELVSELSTPETPVEAPQAATQPEPTPAPTPTPPSETAAPVPVPEKQREEIPLPVFLDMRDKLKAAERERDELRAAQRQPQAVPSIQDDPEAFAAHQADLINRTRTSTIFDVSETMATEKYGAEPVKSAMDWAMQRAEASPAFAAEYLKQKHPIDWAVKQQKRDALLNEMGDDPDAFIARKIAERSAGQAQTPAAPVMAHTQPVAPQAHTPAPPASLASAPSAGGMATIPTGPMAAFDATFRK